MPSAGATAIRQIRQLERAGYPITFEDENTVMKFFTLVPGPRFSPYYGGSYRIKVSLPDDYPSHPPVITFQNTIYHPNIEFSGARRLSLAFLDTSWSSTFDLKMVLQQFLPSILVGPDPLYPANFAAAALYLAGPRGAYFHTARDFMLRHAPFLSVPGAPAPADPPINAHAAPAA